MAQKLAPAKNSVYGTPTPLSAQAPAPVIAKRDPTQSDTGYSIGQMWINPSATTAYLLMNVQAGIATWSVLVD